MRLYTYQNETALSSAAKTGLLTGDPNYAEDEFFAEPYAWLFSRMEAEIGPMPCVPVWAWFSRQNPRSSDFIRKSYRLTIEVPRWRVFLTDYDAWHIPLNGNGQEPDEEWEECLRFARPNHIVQACIHGGVRADEVVEMSKNGIDYPVFIAQGSQL